jgi:hypothetical protein
VQPDESLAAIEVTRLTGDEVFSLSGSPQGVSVLQFWQWTASDLASSTLRGHLAEFLVATALDAVDEVRIEWDACDIHTAAGLRLEVKCSAYVQTWAQLAQTRISFDIAPRASWDSVTNEYLTTVERHSDLYVFCVQTCTDPRAFDSLNLDQWRFYVLPTRVLDSSLGAQKTLALGRLTELGAIECDFAGISDAVASVSH